MGKDRYFISSGKKGKMFTLRVESTVENYNSRGETYYSYYDNHLLTLKTSLEPSIEKAKNYLKKNNINSEIDVRVTEVEKLSPKTEKNWDLMPNGKFMGKNFKSLEDNYLLGWLSGYHKAVSYQKLVKRVFDYFGDRIVYNLHYQRYTYLEWELNRVKREKRITQEKENSRYFGRIGERVERKVMIKKIHSYERQSYYSYGKDTVYITVLEDEEGHRFVYHSTNSIRKNIGSFTLYFREGDSLTLRFGIKDHTEYKGFKQTVIERPSVTITYKKNFDGSYSYTDDNGNKYEVHPEKYYGIKCTTKKGSLGMGLTEIQAYNDAINNN